MYGTPVSRVAHQATANPIAGAKLEQITQHIRTSVSASASSMPRATRDRSLILTRRLNQNPQRRELRLLCGNGCLATRDRHRQRHQQGLSGNTATLPGQLESFIVMRSCAACISTRMSPCRPSAGRKYRVTVRPQNPVAVFENACVKSGCAASSVYTLRQRLAPAAREITVRTAAPLEDACAIDREGLRPT